MKPKRDVTKCIPLMAGIVELGEKNSDNNF